MQIEPGKALLRFTKMDGRWSIEWHSNIEDYARIRAVIGRHDEPEPIIAELGAMGIAVVADINLEDQRAN